MPYRGLSFHDSPNGSSSMLVFSCLRHLSLHDVVVHDVFYLFIFFILLSILLCTINSRGSRTVSFSFPKFLFCPAASPLISLPLTNETAIKPVAMICINANTFVSTLQDSFLFIYLFFQISLLFLGQKLQNRSESTLNVVTKVLSLHSVDDCFLLFVFF